MIVQKKINSISLAIVTLFFNIVAIFIQDSYKMKAYAQACAKPVGIINSENIYKHIYTINMKNEEKILTKLGDKICEYDVLKTDSKKAQIKCLIESKNKVEEHLVKLFPKYRIVKLHHDMRIGANELCSDRGKINKKEWIPSHNPQHIMLISYILKNKPQNK
ncbi:hypothetical protein [Anabaena catenula]|uniref:Uncharacterized protein n=1 Tax=Anabaena catenula FACHB-362 TaxID=2692877 RepID=A0ABR8J851_9NOST|nr:hypothetical protein [Anabaena catenula]MBD2694547.1 hypothetical protein [Anabaena catenula FACHB-362]